MYSIQHIKYNFDTATQPGLRGPLGQTNQNYELRQTCPELEPVIFERTLDEVRQNGSNLQNGHIPSPFTGGLGAVTVEDNDYQNLYHPQAIGERLIAREDNINLHGFNLPNPGDEWRARMLYENKGSKRDYGFYPLPAGVGRRANNLIPGRTRMIFPEESNGPIPTTNLNLVNNGGMWNQPCKQDNRDGVPLPVKTEQPIPAPK